MKHTVCQVGPFAEPFTPDERNALWSMQLDGMRRRYPVLLVATNATADQPKTLAVLVAVPVRRVVTS